MQKIYNMEDDIKQCEWICAKIKESKQYAESLYATLCNRKFVNLDVFAILSDQSWSISWRGAAQMIADIAGSNNYRDYYNVPYGSAFNIIKHHQASHDLRKLGWTIKNE